MPSDCQPQQATTKLCDCERGHNGFGIAGRECDCGPALPPESDDVATIARAVTALRKAHNLSLDQVAARAGMSKSHVWEIEQGRTRNPTVAAVRALARAFGVSIGQILGEDVAAPTLSPAALRVAAMFDAEVRANG